jgi:cation:H+ antiporter
MSKHPAVPTHKPNPAAALSLLGLALGLTLPAVVIGLGGFDPAANPIFGLFVFGFGIVASAFALTWAAEVAQLEIGSGLAIVFLALVTVLPEYAVDLTFAWRAAAEPEFQSLALANMSGANRLLIGIGWPIVALIAWYRFSRTETVLSRRRSGEVIWLLIATLYSLTIPLKGYLGWYDAIAFALCYFLYVRGTKDDPGDGGHDLVGPPVVMADWPKRRRRASYLFLFVWAAVVIFIAAHPFSDSLVHAGTRLGIDKVLMVQWLAPLASEAPEFVVVVLLTMRGRPDMGLGAFVSSKINQWTLLVGGVPIAFGLAHLKAGHGFATHMSIDGRQVEELWLTATQGLYATATILDLRFSLRQALTILGLFLVQFVGSLWLELVVHRHDLITPFHNGLSILYSVLALVVFVNQRHEFMTRIRDVFGKGPPAPTRDAPPHRDSTPDESDA